ncbi:NAD-P-binding protein [Stereum hirsutum FP-91666 SS1]|uniref:NAD-P-binding protein n=1 Tax=Stereum hirsutum (strain FP-91666) TaxID=721885 RepID=UPI000444940B|nr:NAD-P-binding protein [Stereum hirsutum FP-91666 SS1]EIM82292.1 NAD-P-binding protein [Stereum hirsutum FP-91666 SS1]
MSNNTSFCTRRPFGNAGLHKSTSLIPTPNAYEVLVRIHAVSLNFRDTAVYNGLNLGTQMKEEPVLCSDMAGEVVEVGEGVREWRKGDRVTANFDQSNLYGIEGRWDQHLGGPIDGVLQQYRVFHSTGLLHVPKHLSYEEAACFPCAGVTSWNALFGGGVPLKPGQTVLFKGTGGVSITGLILAHAAGAKTIITSSSDDKLKLAKGLGATYTINYNTHPDWDKVVLEMTDNVGAHHIFDTIGINDLDKSFACVAPGGVINSIGILGGPPTANPNVPLLALMKGAYLRGILVGSKQMHEDLLRFVEAKELKPYIHKVFPFQKAPEAFEYMAAGHHSGKIVIRVTE